MKKLLMVAMALIIACGASYAQEKSLNQLRKERAELRKMTAKEFNTKATKAARNEAKALKKEGWKVNPGTLPLEKQLDNSYLKQQEFDDDLFPKYIMADGKSIGESYEAARAAAESLAKGTLAGRIQTEVAALIENTIANKQLAPQEAASIVETVQSSKELITQSIGRTLPMVECYRELKKNGNIEVLIRIAYSEKMAKEAVKRAVRAELEKKGDDLHEKLDKALGL
jgi:hypothetical protein